MNKFNTFEHKIKIYKTRLQCEWPLILLINGLQNTSSPKLEHLTAKEMGHTYQSSSAALFRVNHVYTKVIVPKTIKINCWIQLLRCFYGWDTIVTLPDKFKWWEGGLILCGGGGCTQVYNVYTCMTKYILLQGFAILRKRQPLNMNLETFCLNRIFSEST